MSVGAAYTNTFQGPCAGLAYAWSPPITVQMNGADFTKGFGPLIIDRGKFRNYYVSKNGTTTPNIIVSSPAKNIQGNIYSPVINATRPLAISVPVALSKNQNVVIKGEQSDLIIFSNLTSISGNLATVQIEYDLSFYVNDPILSKYKLNSSQQDALVSMQSNGVTPEKLSIFLDGLSPNVVHIYSDNTEIPFDISNKGIQITRLRNTVSEKDLDFATESSDPSVGPVFLTQTIKIKNEVKDRNAFPNTKEIKFSIDSSFLNSSLVFVLKKIMFFSADRVNFETGNGVGSSQLPCAALGYSMYVNGNWFPALSLASVASGVIEAGAYSNAFMWPQDARPGGPDVHVKVFSPDYRFNSPGFAHSLNLHIILVSFPFFGPLGAFGLPGVSLPWLVILIGPIPFVKQYIFTGTGSLSSENLKTVAIAQTPYKAKTGSVILLDNAKPVKTFNIMPLKQLLKGNNFYNTYEYNAIGVTSTTLFQNVFSDQYAITTKSNTYSGSPQRTSVYLNAYDNLAPAQYKTLNSFYQSYIVVNKDKYNLYDIFTHSEPCLIFKLQFDSGNSSNVFQEGGFYSASIKCSVTDHTNLFDTKLIYRIYAAQDSNFSPSSNIKYTLKIGRDGENGLENPYIKFSPFDSNWDFSNVLITGNIEATLQQISAEVMINSVQNGISGGTFNTPPVNYNLYCAIYSASTLNDNPNNYDISNFTSLDLPLVNFSVTTDCIIALPIYLRQSLKNGGSLEAMRDYGYVGNYTNDSNQYAVNGVLYSGKNYDNTAPYGNIINSTTKYNNLLIMSSTGLGTTFSMNINGGSIISPTVTEADFVLDLPSYLENAQISSGEWALNLELDSVISSLKYKFEIDFIDSVSANLIYKIINSELSSNSSMKETISVPFFLSNQNGMLIVKLFIYNYGLPHIINVKSFTLTSNTIGYFQYTTNQTAHGVPVTFYEDLPVQPTSYIGNCNDFILYLDIPSFGSAIYDPAVGYEITGAIRSPTYKIDLPNNLEVDYRGIINDSLFPRATGVQPYKLFFRTGIANHARVIDTKKHKSTGLIVTVTNSLDSTNENSTEVTQIVSESYARFFKRQNTLNTVFENGYLEPINIQYPIMTSDNEILISGQLLSSTNVTTATLNLESPGSYAIQPNFGGEFSPIDNTQYIRAKLQKCSCIAFDTKDNKTFMVGVTENGNLLYIEDAVISQNIASQFVFVEGDPNSANSFNDVVSPSVSVNNTTYYGLVNISFPGLIITNTNDVLVFYIYSKSTNGVITNTAIYVKKINGGVISKPYLLFDFQSIYQQYNKIDFNFPSINQINVTHADIYDYGREYYLAFDCSGKIFFMKLLYVQSILAYCDLLIVYGNLNQTSSSNLSVDQKFIIGLNNLISNGVLRKLSFHSSNSNQAYSTDLESTQRVGVVDFDGLYLGVQYISGTTVNEVVFEKSYSVPGEIRQISS